ncbi:MAG: V4R domain-containing protein [Candidatus Methanomethylicaceae archaeon]
MENLKNTHDPSNTRQIKNDYAVILKDQTLADIKSALKALFGPADQAFLYAIGKMYGIYYYKQLLNSDVSSSSNILEQIFEFKREEGWGNFEINLENGEFKNAVVRDSFEARSYRWSGKSPHTMKDMPNKSLEPVPMPQCSFLKGFLEAVLSFHLKKNIHLNEVECIAAGNDKCIFLQKF